MVMLAVRCGETATSAIVVRARIRLGMKARITRGARTMVRIAHAELLGSAGVARLSMRTREQLADFF
jgi:hypothetical protein